LGKLRFDPVLAPAFLTHATEAAMIATHGLARLPAANSREPATHGLASPFELVGAWRSRRRHRADLRRLLRLGTYLIDDIGLRPDEAAAEAAKPFWRA
jgi:uncharacterized protein YjiS (DUF1127 family)